MANSSCTICSSSLKADIEKMIDNGANNQHIQAWASERDLKLTKRAIEDHKVKHYGYIENIPLSVAELEPVTITLCEIQSALDVGHEELLGYLAANNLKPHHRKKYDLIDILRYFTKELSDRVDQLQERLKQLTPNSQKLAMAELKQQKLEAQTRLLKAVARTKEIELEVALGKLIEERSLEEKWSYSLVGFKAKLESTPNKLALELSAIENESNIRDVLHKSISEALSELNDGS